MTIIQSIKGPVCDIVDVEIVLDNGEHYIPTPVVLGNGFHCREAFA